MRYLILFLLVLFGIWWVRRALERPGEDDSGAARKAGGARKTENPERMLACRHCGIHVPESEGVRAGDEFYCCEEHRRQGPERR